MNLLGPDIRFEIMILINDKGEARSLLPKCATLQEVMMVSEALINASVAMANQYGLQVKLQEKLTP